MKNLTTLIHLKSRANSKGEQPIYLRVTVDSKRQEISLKRSIALKGWDSKKQRGKGNTEAIKTLNKYLRSIEVKIDQTEQQLINAGKRVTIELLMNKYLGVDNKNHTLIEVIESGNKRKKMLIKESTYKHYVAALKHVKSYLKDEYKVTDIDIKEVDYQFILDYDFYLRTKKNVGNNKAVRYVKTLAGLFRTTIEKGWISIDPFVGYKKSKVVKDVAYLTQTEIDIIYNKEFSNKSLERVRDVFIFCCYTALAYCDVERLRDEHITKSIDGYSWIKINRRKTEVICDIPLFPVAEEIIKKYKDDPLVINSGRLLPVLKNQKMNAYLKDIGGLCGISKSLHFHMARHSWGSTIAAANRLPIETTMRIMGHKTIAMARHYAKVSTAMIIEDVAELRKKLEEVQNSSEEDDKAEAV